MSIFIVLGMHKSGTTLISHSLHDSGVNMVDYDILNAKLEYYHGNKYERLTTLRINEYLLKSKFKNSLNIISSEIDKRRSAEISDITAEYIINLRAKHKNMGFKDPRTVLTYRRFWKNYYANQQVLVCVYRSPFDIVNRYTKRNPLNYIKAARAWLIYNKEIIDIIDELPNRVILVNYNMIFNTEYLEKKTNQFQVYIPKFKFSILRKESKVIIRKQHKLLYLIDLLFFSKKLSNIYEKLNELEERYDNIT